VRDTIRFLFGDEARELRGLPPTMTVLEWLRGVARACGTKEGCAEGDCGACTVVLGEPEGAGMRWRAVNACILFLPALDGRQLLTVEHLRAADGALHPVQQALVRHHGSQCGFCTPGFVMSLFALYHAAKAVDRAAANDALAGNLCRCTGYRPILDAARDACSGTPSDKFAASAPEIAARLRAMGDEDLALTHGDSRFFVPRSIEGLAELTLAHPDATLLAGGTDVGLWVTKQHQALPTVIAIERVAALAEITETDGRLVIGARVTCEDALDVLSQHWADLRPMLLRFGSRQIRNRGTIGGNVANGSPIGDTMPALIALDATLVLRRGEVERSLPVEEFFLAYRRTALQPREFLARIEMPLPKVGQVFRMYKISKRFDQDISAVCAAFLLEVEDGAVRDIRIGYGGMAAVPKRAPRTEAVLRGRPWTRAAVEDGMRMLDAELAPISDMRASAEYRSAVARNLLLKLWLETSGEGARTRLAAPEDVAA
jgi:xanthine dehydrogenase small subunit